MPSWFSTGELKTRAKLRHSPNHLRVDHPGVDRMRLRTLQTPEGLGQLPRGGSQPAQREMVRSFGEEEGIFGRTIAENHEQKSLVLLQICNILD